MPSYKAHIATRFGRFRPARFVYDWGTKIDHNYFYFENGFGASVVQGPLTHGGRDGLWELAVLEKTIHGWLFADGNPLGSEVIGHLTEVEVEELLERIEEMPASGREKERKRG